MVTMDNGGCDDSGDYDDSIQFFIIFVPCQQPQGIDDSNTNNN
jgi:hypothetical protein